MGVRALWRPALRVGCSLLGGGIFYAAWMGAFLTWASAGTPFVRAVGWLSAPVATALGFATGLAMSERLINRRKAEFLRLLTWPLVGCAIGAGAVYRFGAMLIVFGMFAAGTASVMLRELVLASRSTAAAGDSRTPEPPR